MDQTTITIDPQAAIPPLSRPDDTVLDAEGAGDTIGCLWRFSGQVKKATRLGVGGLQVRLDLIKAAANAGSTYPQMLDDQWRLDST